MMLGRPTSRVESLRRTSSNFPVIKGIASLASECGAGLCFGGIARPAFLALTFDGREPGAMTGSAFAFLVADRLPKFTLHRGAARHREEIADQIDKQLHRADAAR